MSNDDLNLENEFEKFYYHSSLIDILNCHSRESLELFDLRDELDES